MILWIMFLLGTFLLAIGMAMMIEANFGVSTWDVLHIGLSNQTSLTIGIAVVIVGVLLILFKYLMDRKRPQLGTFLNAILVGAFFNYIQAIQLIPTVHLFAERFFLLLLGIIIMGTGSGMYVATGVGAGPRDGFTLAAAKKFNLSIRSMRTIIEALILLLGWFLGGPVSFGTFLSIFLIGTVLQASLLFWRKQLGKLTNPSIETEYDSAKNS